MGSTIARSVAKAVTYRFVSTLYILVVTYFITRSLLLTGLVGLADLVKIAIYCLHERAWKRVRWGKTEANP